MAPKGLLERLSAGESVVVAEGYIFEFERKGYLKAGAFVPEVLIEHPELVRQAYREFVHAGSDVVQAFTYYAHRAKLQIIGREDDLEKMNRHALKMAREVADETGTMMAGNISNTSLYKPKDAEAAQRTYDIFKEQILWAVDERADFIIAETYTDLGEAELALKAIKEFGNGLPAVITLSSPPGGTTVDGVPLPEACRRLEEQGADVVGLNCTRGPATIVKLMTQIRKVCKGHLACLPVTYRTNDAMPAFTTLRDPDTGKNSFPVELDSWLINRSHVVSFTQEMMDLGIRYLGLCCGNRPFYTRAMAETLGRRPPASKYSPDLSQHISQVRDEEHSRGYDVAKKLGIVNIQ